MMALLVIVALGAAVFFYKRSQDSERIQGAAATDAANQAGNSAQQAGKAAEKAARNLGGE
jgi:uncharacterized protein (UPF0333 family)